MITFKTITTIRSDFKIKKHPQLFKYSKNVFHLEEDTKQSLTYFNKKKTIKIEFAKKKILGFTLSSFDLKVSSL